MAAPFTSLRKIDRWADPVLLKPAVVDVAEFGKFNLRARTDDLWHVTPLREPVVSRQITERLSEGDTFVDAGANIGVFTIPAARIVGKSGRVIAIEMIPETAAILRQHITLNDATNVTVVEKALGSVEDVPIEVTVRPEQSGQATVVRHEHQAGGKTLTVFTTTLAKVLEGVDRVSLIKIDIEGAELDALKGAGAALDRVDAIIFEQLRGADDTGSFLEGRGFRVRCLQGNNFVAERV